MIFWHNNIFQSFVLVVGDVLPNYILYLNQTFSFFPFLFENKITIYPLNKKEKEKNRIQLLKSFDKIAK